MIKINATVPGKKIHNFWNNIHFHPTDAIEDEWGQEVLDSVSRDKVAQCVRIYAMLEDIVTRDEKGNLQYDFADTDLRIDYLVSRGFKLLICMNFLPTAIAKDKTCISQYPRYKGKRLNTSYPEDYKLWQEICGVYVKHLLERYGEELVHSWYFHCWNEANHAGFWLSNEPDWNVRAEEYLKLYDHFAEGITAVDPKVKIGGPSAGYNFGHYPRVDSYNGYADAALLYRFFDHIKNGKNYANGGIGTKIDFYSIHVYGHDHDFTELDPMDSYNIGQDHIHIAQVCGFGRLPVIGDEWEATTEGYKGYPDIPSYNYRNTSMFAAHYFALIDCFLKNNAPYQHLMICLSGQHDLKEDFYGSRTFATKSGFKLPIYNGYAMAAMLGENQLECSNDTKVGVIPTMDEDGNVIVALYNYTVNRLRLKGTQHVRLELQLPEGEYTVSHYRLDEENCNSYTAWKKLGSPRDISMEDRETIRHSAKLKLWYPQESFCGSVYTDSIVLPDDAISLIKLTKVK